MDSQQYRDDARRKQRHMTHQQEIDLAAEIADGNDAALYELADPHLLTAVREAERAQRLSRQNARLERLIRAANEGLYRAARMYPAKGTRFRFGDYALWWIRHYLSRVSGGTANPESWRPTDPAD